MFVCLFVCHGNVPYGAVGIHFLSTLMLYKSNWGLDSACDVVGMANQQRDENHRQCSSIIWCSQNNICVQDARWSSGLLVSDLHRLEEISKGRSLTTATRACRMLLFRFMAVRRNRPAADPLGRLAILRY